MPPRRMIHPENRIFSSEKTPLETAVSKVREKLHNYLTSEQGKGAVSSLKETSNTSSDNMRELDTVIKAFLALRKFIENKGPSETYDSFLIHMALSEIDRRYDEARSKAEQNPE